MGARACTQTWTQANEDVKTKGNPMTIVILQRAGRIPTYPGACLSTRAASISSPSMPYLPQIFTESGSHTMSGSKGQSVLHYIHIKPASVHAIGVGCNHSNHF